MKPIIINTCDAWQSYSSFRLAGVFTIRTKLNTFIKHLIKANKIDFDGNVSEIKDMTIDELQMVCTYINFNEIELNENLL